MGSEAVNALIDTEFIFLILFTLRSTHHSQKIQGASRYNQKKFLKLIVLVGTFRNAAAMKRIQLDTFHILFLSSFGELQFSQKTEINAKLNTMLPFPTKANKCNCFARDTEREKHACEIFSNQKTAVGYFPMEFLHLWSLAETFKDRNLLSVASDRITPQERLLSWSTYFYFSFRPFHKYFCSQMPRHPPFLKHKQQYRTTGRLRRQLVVAHKGTRSSLSLAPLGWLCTSPPSCSSCCCKI